MRKLVTKFQLKATVRHDNEAIYSALLRVDEAKVALHDALRDLDAEIAKIGVDFEMLPADEETTSPDAAELAEKITSSIQEAVL